MDTVMVRLLDKNLNLLLLSYSLLYKNIYQLVFIQEVRILA